ncbi:IS3 family transposase [Pseudomonas aeruginosa]|nr:IS3 family transposase [Pseudomonas aeruginosa]HBO3623450.1 IS3 family transposase [Pseudomonas aeruginosa]HCF5590238.1 IS3 family transposase [Pseudomonas aeruginosa]
MLQLIRDSYAASSGVYGARRVFGDLREAGESCGKHRVARLMRAHKIKALRGYKAPRPIAGRPSIIAPNHLNREFTVDAPNKAWVTDITYIRTWQGWLYLAVVVDLLQPAALPDGRDEPSLPWRLPVRNELYCLYLGNSRPPQRHLPETPWQHPPALG